MSDEEATPTPSPTPTPTPTATPEPTPDPLVHEGGETSYDGFDAGELSYEAGDLSAFSGGQPSAELVLDQIYVLPEGARASDSLTIGAQVRNDGATESGRFTVRFWLDGVVINNLPWESVAPGQPKWQEMEHPAIHAGTHNVAAMADFENVVHESNKEDNLRTLQFQILETPGVIDFSGDGEDIPVPVIKMGARANAAQEITRIVNNYAAEVTEIWTRYSEGLTRFGQTMEHSSAKEAEFNMDTVAKGAVKKMFDQALSAVVDLAPVPGLKQGVDLVKSTVEGYFAEQDRSKKAWSEHAIVEYIESVDKQIEEGRPKMRRDIEALAQPLADAFDEISKNDPQHGDATPGGVIVGGEGGKFLLDLRQKLGAIQSQMPSAAEFERAIAVAFTHVASSSGEVQGRLIFHMELYRLSSGWAPGQTDGSIGWTLESSAPGEPARLAEALTRSLNGKKAWQVNLPKTVVMALSSERGDDPFAKGEIHFTDDPSAYDLAAVEASGDMAHATSELHEAWDRPSVKGLALDADKISA